MAELYPFQQQNLNSFKHGEVMIISAGRNMGKSELISYWNAMRNTYTPKIKWQRLPGLKLQAYTDDVAPRGFERGLRESDMDPIQAWCEECHCGTRMSFNVFKFENAKQITMFVIKWTE